jgi:hypothetical protein
MGSVGEAKDSLKGPMIRDLGTYGLAIGEQL